MENSVLTKPGYHPTVQALDLAEKAVIAIFAVAGHDVESLFYVSDNADLS